MPTGEAICSVNSHCPGFYFSFAVITDAMYEYVLNVLQNVTSRGHFWWVLCEDSDSMRTPCLLGISVLLRLRVWLFCPSKISSTFSCGISFTTEMKWHFHSQNTSESIQLFKQCLRMVDVNSFSRVNQSALKEHRNYSHLQHAHHSHSVLFCMMQWFQPCVCLFVLCFSQDAASLCASFIRTENTRICNFIFIDNILKHIKNCMHHNFIEPRNSNLRQQFCLP